VSEAAPQSHPSFFLHRLPSLPPPFPPSLSPTFAEYHFLAPIVPLRAPLGGRAECTVEYPIGIAEAPTDQTHLALGWVVRGEEVGNVEVRRGKHPRQRTLRTCTRTAGAHVLGAIARVSTSEHGTLERPLAILRYSTLLASARTVGVVVGRPEEGPLASSWLRFTYRRGGR